MSEEPKAEAKDTVTICITLFVFRGDPDVYFNRHVILYFTSPDLPDFHETVMVQRENDTAPWRVEQFHISLSWALDHKYLSHVNAGAVQVDPGLELAPVAVAATVPVEGREAESDWNCQTFVLEGLRGLVDHKLQTQEWYDAVEGELLNQVLEGAVP